MPYKILNHIGDYGSCSSYRNLLPVIHCRDELLKCGIEIHNQTNMNNPSYDAYIFNRIPNPKSFILINMLYSAGKKIVWELDDELWNVSPSNKGAYETYDLTMNYFLSLYLSMSSIISVSTKPLAESLIARFKVPPSKVHVLENLVDINDYMAFNNSSKTRTLPLKIMWSGSDSHVEDMEPVKCVYEYFKDNKDVIFIFHGYLPEEFAAEKPDRLIFLPFHPRKHYEGIISLMSPDIALIPLKNNQFNRCKSAIKYYEMTMAGAACIASNMSPYSDVMNYGYLCSNSIEWINKCKSIVEDSERIDALNYNQQCEVISEYSWNTDNPRKRAWLEFFRSIPDIGENKISLPIR